MRRANPAQPPEDEMYRRELAISLLATGIARNAGTWMLDADQVAVQLGCSAKHVRDLKNATEPVNGQPPLTGWNHHGSKDKLAADRLARYIAHLPVVA